jgi:hypothetical protein
MPVAHQILTPQELSLLDKANEIYKTEIKGFEYFRVHDAVRGFSNFPNLNDLDALSKKIIEG